MDLVDSLNSSLSSFTVPDELKGLSSQEIALLDAVIARAGPNATTFLTVFKAYNDVLSEHGIDPHETLYYGKLLKLGTLKGASWHDKWSTIKSRQSHLPTARPNAAVPQLYDEHSVTVDSEDIFSEIGQRTVPQYHQTQSFASPSLQPIDMSVSYNINKHPLLRHPRARPLRTTWQEVASEATDDDLPLSTLPPSYRSADAASEITPQPSTFSPRLTSSRRRHPSLPRGRTSLSRRRRSHERTGSGVNEEEAWKKIRMDRDEEDADQFRDERLLERCWHVWKQGFLWIEKTNEQIYAARNNLLLRIFVQRWQDRLFAKQDLAERVSTIHDHRLLRHMLARWKQQLKAQKQLKWRDSMRQKMHLIRTSREARVKRDAWAKWRQSWKSHLSDQHFAHRLTQRHFVRWKVELKKHQRMEDRADQLYESASGERAVRCWDHWRKAIVLREAEAIIRRKNEDRLLRNAMLQWTLLQCDNDKADALYRKIAIKHMIRRWKESLARLVMLEQRADRHIQRQDHLLIIAVARVWKAQERGRLLARVRAHRAIKRAFRQWRLKIESLRHLQALSVDFALHSSSQLLVAAFRVWKGTHISHQNATNFAIQYHNSQVRYRYLMKMRLQLRDHLRRYKKARIMAVTLAKRRAFRNWLARLKVQQREKKLLQLLQHQRRRVFDFWRRRTHQQISYRHAEQIISDRVQKHILATFLARWTNRVIDVKLRELEVSQRSDLSIMRRAFIKWKGVRIRHVEELSLMESYQIIKQDEIVRRLFHRWLSTARTSRYRRVTLTRKEQDMKSRTLRWAWDKWAERYNDEKLRPLEISLLLQTQKNMLFQAYGIWYSRTKAIPAIRFHNTHLKTKVWAKWVSAIPRALQTKAAKDHYQKYLLAFFLHTWIHQYRARLARRAIARARHLRLPTSTTPRGRPTSVPRPEPRSPPHSIKDDIESNHRNSPWYRPRTTDASWTNLDRRKRSSPSRWKSAAPSARSSSPAKSMASAPARTSREILDGPSAALGGDVTAGRSRLWMELQEVKKARPSRSNHSRTRDSEE